jgi:hypothetical protein
VTRQSAQAALSWNSQSSQLIEMLVVTFAPSVAVSGGEGPAASWLTASQGGVARLPKAAPNDHGDPDQIASERALDATMSA